MDAHGPTSGDSDALDDNTTMMSNQHLPTTGMGWHHGTSRHKANTRICQLLFQWLHRDEIVHRKRGRDPSVGTRHKLAYASDNRSVMDDEAQLFERKDITTDRSDAEGTVKRQDGEPLGLDRSWSGDREETLRNEEMAGSPPSTSTYNECMGSTCARYGAYNNSVGPAICGTPEPKPLERVWQALFGPSRNVGCSADGVDILEYQSTL